MMKQYILVLFAVLALTFSCVNMVWAAAEVWVDDDFTSVSAGGHIWDTDAFDTIQEGIDAVDAGGAVYVAEGTYPENVAFSSKSFSLEGAKQGIDARTRLATEPAGESIIEGFVHLGNGTGPTIDGFTVRLGTITCYADGAHVLNNIIKDYKTGMYLRNPGNEQTVIQYNVFKNIIDVGVPGTVGDAIYSDGISYNILNDSNIFMDLDYAAIIMTGAQQEVTFSNNRIFRCKKQAVNLYNNCTSVTIMKNYIENANMDGDADRGGIRFYSTPGPVNVKYNTVVDSFSGVCFKNYDYTGDDIHINYNALFSNSNAAIDNTGTGIVDCEYNFYGDNSGPTNAGNPGGTGDAVKGDCDFDPWIGKSGTFTSGLALSPLGTGSATTPSGSGGSGVEVLSNSNATSSSIILIEYNEEFPQGYTGFAGGNAIDRRIEVITLFDPGEITAVVKIYYTAQELSDSGIFSGQWLSIRKWDEGTSKWIPAGTNHQGDIPPDGILGHYGTNSSENYVWVIVDEFSEFAAGQDPTVPAELSVFSVE